MMFKTALAILLIGAQPAVACHRFSRWHYPWAQRCWVTAHVAYHPPGRTPEDRSYFVEVTQVPPLPALNPQETQAPEKPLETDLRTPEQIQESDEHDAVMKNEHDRINALIKLLQPDKTQ
jgi:hypothetical protein